MRPHIAKHHPVSTEPEFPKVCSACHSQSGVALRAIVGRRHGSVHVWVHCSQCRHEWRVELPNRGDALATPHPGMACPGSV